MKKALNTAMFVVVAFVATGCCGWGSGCCDRGYNDCCYSNPCCSSPCGTDGYYYDEGRPNGSNRPVNNNNNNHNNHK